MKSNRLSQLRFPEKNRMHLSRNYAKDTCLEIMFYNIGGYLGQKMSISLRQVNVNMFPVQLS